MEHIENYDFTEKFADLFTEANGYTECGDIVQIDERSAFMPVSFRGERYVVIAIVRGSDGEPTDDDALVSFIYLDREQIDSIDAAWQSGPMAICGATGDPKDVCACGRH